MNDAGDQQARALRQVEALRLRCEGAADGLAVMQGVKLCLLHRVAPPDWLAQEFVRRHHLVADAHVASWDDAFGRPWPKRTRLASVRRHLALVRQVHSEVWRLAVEHPGRGIRREHLFTDVSLTLNREGLSPGGVERLYYQALAQGFVNVAQWRRSMLALGGSVRKQGLKAAYRQAIDTSTV
ncbi:hypothetical protein [Sphaerotilus mobilis]|uniref:Uncharacterized protein n=1 Tax=Sphaerotilus mobilis TaxID=47994 RepID=A0A4Q7LBP3_9BURK|nr:hypothetical protein [Sphaerotilus mobilis]RZS47496.1 hypothetical protein EV685_3701 [Sphaerotilus mobilis]